jgi:L-fuconolactonase
VVGWADLRSPLVEQQLSELSKHRRFVGVRHVVQDEPDERFMLAKDFLRGVGALKAFGLVYDILIYPKQLPAAIELAQRFPAQTFVLDHIAKPGIKDQIKSPWADQIRELAKSPNVYCKVSGMVTEAKWGAWKESDFTPFLDVIFEAFGADRVMYGSDWPVCLLSGSYEQVYRLAHSYLRKHAPKTESNFFGENAIKAYGLKP